MNTVCIIPARGGSKGIPRKNLISVAGHPLIAWTIMTAQESRFIKRIIVSTDDQQIARVATRYGAVVLPRPKEISGDSAPSELALLHVLSHLEKSEACIPDLVVFMQCTSPLTRSSDIDAAIEYHWTQGADVVFSGVPSHVFLWRNKQDGQAVGINHHMLHRPMRQERDPEFIETGAFYILRTTGLLKHRFRFFGKVMIYPVAPEYSLDIDESWEVPIAELLLNRRIGEGL